MWIDFYGNREMNVCIVVLKNYMFIVIFVFVNYSL